MEKTDFKSTWQKVKVESDDPKLGSWKGFKGRVKISPDDPNKLILEKEFQNHKEIDIISKVAKCLVEDKKGKKKAPAATKLYVTVGAPEIDDGTKHMIFASKKEADAFLAERSNFHYSFEWTAPEELMEKINEAETFPNELFKLGFDVEAEYSEELKSIGKDEFEKQKIADKFSVVLRKGKASYGEYYLMQLVEKTKWNSDNIDKNFEEKIEAEDLEDVDERMILWKDPDEQVLYDIFCNQIANIMDSDDLDNENFDYDTVLDTLNNLFQKGNKTMSKTIEGSDGVTRAVEAGSTKDKVLVQGKAVGNAIMKGAAMAAADQGGELLLDLAKAYIPTMPVISDLLESDEGREFLKAFMAMMVHTVAHQTNLLPRSEIVAQVAEHQLTLSSYKLIGPQLAVLRKFAVQMADVGEKMDALGAFTLEKDMKPGDLLEVEVLEVENESRAFGSR